MTTCSGLDREHEPQEPGTGGHPARTYVTEVWCPPRDTGVQRLHSRMKEPEPEPEAGP